MNARPNESEPQRYAIFWIDTQQLMAVLGLLACSRHPVRPVCRNLPVTAKVVTVHFDWQRNAFGVVVEHELFSPVEPGQPIPWLDRLDVEVGTAPPAKPFELSREKFLAAIKSGPIQVLPDGKNYSLVDDFKDFQTKAEALLESQPETLISPAAEEPAPIDPRPACRGGWF